MPPPSVIDYTHGSFKIKFPGGSNGVVVRPDSLVLTSASRKHEDGTRKSVLCCYDAQLHLLAKKEIKGGFYLKACDHKGRVLVLTDFETGPVITRYRLRFE